MPSEPTTIGAVAALVEASRRRAVVVVLIALAAAAALGLYAVRHIGMDSNTEHLMSPNLAWRRADAELDRLFPQNRNVLAAVVDGTTPDQSEDAAATLAASLRARPNLYRDVREPGSGPFFQTEGLLYLPVDQVRDMANQLAAAQPLLGTLAADPSARGVFDALDLFAQGAAQGATPAARLDRPFRVVADAVEAGLAGRGELISWESLLSNRKPMARELRRFVLAVPVLDYGALEPGKRAVDTIYAEAEAHRLVPAQGVTVRVTGPVALSDDQFSALREGAGLVAGCAFALLAFWLILAVRSVKSAAAILVTLLTGLVYCVAFAAGVVGPFDPISVAFGPLFVGIAVDFGIQFSVRFAAECHESDTRAEALRRTARGVGMPLLVAATATAAGFFSLVPTAYRGISHLGLIAGAGMAIALGLNLTLLPALLSIFHPKGFAEASGFSWGGAADGFLARHRYGVRVFGIVLAAGAAAAAVTLLHFDFDPVNLENPNAVSVRTLVDLMQSPDTTPYTVDVLEPNAAAARALADRLAALPQVSQALWLGSFVPDQQSRKLAILADTSDLLGTTLEPIAVKPAPDDQAVAASAAHCAADLAKLAASDPAAARLAAALRRVAAAGPAALRQVQINVAEGIKPRLDDLRLVLQAKPVTLGNIPPEVRGDWIASDGQYRVQVFPKGDPRRQAVLRGFVEAVRRVAPNAAGMPVDILESARLVESAFVTAGILAVAAITLLLAVALRNVRHVVTVLGPLILAGLLTLGTSALVGLPLNFANIVTLPLLLGVGVAFDIYFVIRHRRGEPGLLRSPTARGVVFSALATGTAFASLIVSQSPGIADMGKLLSLGLVYTLICTLFYLPTFLRPEEPAEERPVS